MGNFNKIAFVAPNLELYNMGLAIKDKYNIMLFQGDLLDGVVEAKKALEQGAEIIISRGGTATLISQNVDCPVIELRVTSYDLIRALLVASKMSTNIAVIGFSNIIEGASELGELLNIKTRNYVIYNSSDVDELFKNAIVEGIDVVVGDATTVYHSSKRGLRGIFISSGKESIITAVEEALRFIEINQVERENAELLKTIVGSIHDGIIAINKEGMIRALNKKAAEQLGIDREKSLRILLSDVVKNFSLQDVLITGKEELGKIEKINNHYLVVNKIPMKIKGEIVGVVATIQDITEIQKTEEKVRKEIYNKGLIAEKTIADIVAVTEVMRRVLSQVEKVGTVDSTVLITGESGTGKEIIAQSIHNMSKRKNGPFVAVNCATFMESLLESELFGYEEGSFTGAKKGGKEGLFELAHKGTLFLDEIGEMPANLQAHLLRVLQEGKIRRLGADYVIPVDVRIIAATNIDIQEHIQKGLFRSDLYYRLNILPIHLPSLKERKEDIPLLVSAFLKICNQKLGKMIYGFSKGALDLIKQHEWPGNIRQLLNFIEMMVVYSDGPIIKKEDVYPFIQSGLEQEVVVDGELRSHPKNESKKIAEPYLKGTLEEIELKIIQKVFEEEGGNFSKTAKRLGIHRSTLHRKIGDATFCDSGAKLYN